eukprot:TRINITY_DN16029_c0_g1_i1.p1 TRINITY_DN16029_c0_g1~~TRINITY_DN16029_c0_g1_i1.p1  ORF type:complete len:154 (+),score=18.79 TRINITY_DN16029_c0_g1_i1:109-570(+)
MAINLPPHRPFPVARRSLRPQRKKQHPSHRKNRPPRRTHRRQAEDEEPKSISKVFSDVIETDATVTFMIDLPGLKKEDIAISLTQNLLTVSGERKKINPTKSAQVTSRRRGYGTFNASFMLKYPVGEGIKAIYEDGVLVIDILKIPAKRIAVF